MISLSDIRMWIMDRTPADNPLEGDLFFTDEEIAAAMKAAAREYNSIPPYVSMVDPAHLPDDTNLFFEAVAEFLIRMKLHSMKRNASTYTGGNVSVDTDQLQIKLLDDLVKNFTWRETARQIKLKIDTTNYYRTSLG